MLSLSIVLMNSSSKSPTVLTRIIYIDVIELQASNPTDSNHGTSISHL